MPKDRVTRTAQVRPRALSRGNPARRISTGRHHSPRWHSRQNRPPAVRAWGPTNGYTTGGSMHPDASAVTAHDWTRFRRPAAGEPALATATASGGIRTSDAARERPASGASSAERLPPTRVCPPTLPPPAPSPRSATSARTTTPGARYRHCWCGEWARGEATILQRLPGVTRCSRMQRPGENGIERAMGAARLLIRASFQAWRSGLELRASGVRPVDMEELAAGLIHTLVGVGSEVVALGLEEVGGEPGGAVGVVVAQGAGEGGHGHAVDCGASDDCSPVVLVALDDASKVLIKQEVGQIGVALIGLKHSTQFR